MKNRYIIQILGKVRGYQPVKYKINDFGPIDTKLSSIALYKFYKNKNENPKIIYYVPESLIIDYSKDIDELIYYIRNYNEFLEIFNNEFKKQLLEDNNINYELKVLQSIGLYTTRNNTYQIEFSNYFENLVSQIFLDIKNLSGNITIDISTGFNILVQSLNEAIRNFIVYRKLKNILDYKSTDFDIKYSISSPILGNLSYTRNINFYKISVKTFFEFPLKLQDIKNNNLFIVLDGLDKNEKKRIGKIMPRIDKNSRNLIEYFNLIFNSIKQNAPLVLFTKRLMDFQNFDEIFNQEMNKISNLVDFIKNNEIIEYNQNILKISRLRIKRILFFNYLFTLALGYNLREIYINKVRNVENTLDNIENTIIKIYEQLGLGMNKRFFIRDLNEIKNNMEKISENETYLSKILVDEEIIKRKESKEKNKQKLPYSDDKRNFFAHSGLLSNMVLTKKNENSKILIRYDEKYLDKIKSWVLNPES